MRGKPLAVVFLTVFLDLLGFGVVIPLLPFLAESTGASPFQVTLLMASYSLMQFVMAPVWGRLSDRVGRRPVLLASVAGSVAALLLFAFSTTYPMLLLARVAHGAMNANLAVAQAAIADVTTPENRAKGMGLFGAAFGLGFIFGPAIGGLLGHFGFRLAGLAAAGFAALNLVLAFALLPETRPVHARGAPSPKPWRLLEATLLKGEDRRGLRALLVVSLLATLGFSAMESVFSLWTERAHGWGPLQNGLLFAYLGVVLVVVQGFLMGPLRRRYGETSLAGASLCALTLSLALLPISLALGLLLAVTGLLALAQGILSPNLSALVTHEATTAETGRVLGAYQSVNALARVAGPLLAGALFTVASPGMPFLAGALLTAGALAALPRRKERGALRGSS